MGRSSFAELTACLRLFPQKPAIACLIIRLRIFCGGVALAARRDSADGRGFAGIAVFVLESIAKNHSTREAHYLREDMVACTL